MMAISGVSRSFWLVAVAASLTACGGSDATMPKAVNKGGGAGSSSPSAGQGGGGKGGGGQGGASDGGTTTAEPNAGTPSVEAGAPPTGSAQGDMNVWTPVLKTDNDNATISWEGLLVDPVRKGEVYAFCQLVDFGSRVVFRSSDYGLTWKRVDSDEVKGSAWGNAIDPNPDRDPMTWPTLYSTAGYGSQGVWKSNNGGVTWVNLFPDGGTVAKKGGGTVSFPPDKNGQTTDFYQVHVAPDNPPNHLLVTYHYGTPGVQALGESTDGGQTWEVHNVPWGDSHYVYAIDAVTWLIIAGESTGGGLRRTTTAGRVDGKISEDAWTQVDDLEHLHGAFTPWYDEKSKTLYFPGKAGIRASSDGGATWQPIFDQPMSTLAATGTTLFANQQGSPKMWQAPVDNPASLAETPMPAGWGNNVPPYGATSIFDGKTWVVLEATRKQLGADNKTVVSRGEVWRYLGQ